MSAPAWRSTALAVALEAFVVLAGVAIGHVAGGAGAGFAFDWDVALVVWMAAASLVVWTIERVVAAPASRRARVPARRR